VTSIGQTAISQTGLTSLTIPDNVTSTVYQAFAFNTSLTTVTIGNGLGNIAGFAFRNCTSLSTLSCTATDAPTLGTTPFDGCTSLSEIQVPNSAVADYQAKGEGNNKYGGLEIVGV